MATVQLQSIEELVQRALRREALTREEALWVLSRSDSIFIGDHMTTKGQAAPADLEMIADAGFVLEGAHEAPSQNRAWPVVLKTAVLEG